MDPVPDPDPPHFGSKSVPGIQIQQIFYVQSLGFFGIATDGNKCKFYRCILSGPDVILGARHQPNWTSFLILVLSANSEKGDLRSPAEAAGARTPEPFPSLCTHRGGFGGTTYGRGSSRGSNRGGPGPWKRVSTFQGRRQERRPAGPLLAATTRLNLPNLFIQFLKNAICFNKHSKIQEVSLFSFVVPNFQI